MASKKITELTAATTLADTDILVAVDGIGSTPTTKKITVANAKTIMATDISGKVDKVAGSSLVADTEIAKIHAAGSDNQDLSGLATKVAVPTENNFAGLDATGNIKDSGSKAGDFATAGHNHTGVYAPVLGADDNYVTDAEKIVIGNTSGVNTGDQTLPVKATGAELDTGTDDAKFATAKALADSGYEKNPMTTAGDIIYGGADGVPTRLAKGTASQVLAMNSGATAPEWADAGAGGGTTYEEFECIVAESGGDYTLLSSAITAGKKKIFIKDGTYDESAGDIVLPDNIYIQGESMDGTIISFGSSAYEMKTSASTSDTYNTGTMAVTEDSTIITGTGTGWSTNVSAGDYLLFQGTVFKISSVDSDTQLTLECKYMSRTSDGLSYVILKNVTENIKIKDLTINNTVTTPSGYIGILDLVNVVDCLIERVLFQRGSNYTLHTWQAHRTRIKECKVNQFFKYGIITEYSYSEISDCEIRDAYYNYSSNEGIYCGDYPSFIENCTIANLSIGITASSGGIVRNNTIRNTFGSGIKCGSVTSAVANDIVTGGAYGVGIDSDNGSNSIIGNCVKGNSYADIYRATGISSGNNNTIIGNVLDNLSYGIKIGGKYYNNISGNVLLRCLSQIKVTSTSYYNVIEGNTFGSTFTNQIELPENLIGGTVMNNTSYYPIIEMRSIRVMNNTGSTINSGAVVRRVASDTTGTYVEPTTTESDALVCGVVEGNIGAGGYGCMKVYGKTVLLKVDGTTDISVGDFLTTSTTSEVAKKAGSGNTAFAYALEAYSTDDANGVIDAFLIAPRII